MYRNLIRIAQRWAGRSKPGDKIEEGIRNAGERMQNFGNRAGMENQAYGTQHIYPADSHQTNQHQQQNETQSKPTMESKTGSSFQSEKSNTDHASGMKGYGGSLNTLRSGRNEEPSSSMTNKSPGTSSGYGPNHSGFDGYSGLNSNPNLGKSEFGGKQATGSINLDPSKYEVSGYDGSEAIITGAGNPTGLSGKEYLEEDDLLIKSKDQFIVSSTKEFYSGGMAGYHPNEVMGTSKSYQSQLEPNKGPGNTMQNFEGKLRTDDTMPDYDGKEDGLGKIENKKEFKKRNKKDKELLDSYIKEEE